MGNTTKRGRDAATGKFIPISETKKKPDRSVIEKIPTRAPAKAPRR